MTKPKPVTRASVSFRTEDYRVLERIAQKNHVSVAWVVRRAVAAYLIEHGVGKRR